MAGLFAFLFLISLILIPVTLIKPHLFSRFVNSTRKKNLLFFGTLTTIFFVLTGITAPPAPKNESVKKDGESAAVTAIATPTYTITPTITPTESLSPTSTPTPTKTKPTVTPTPIQSSPTRRVIPTSTPRPFIPTSTPIPQVQQVVPPVSSGGFSCDCSKTCTEISSCTEAQFLLNSCGCSARDADRDGIACDSAPLNCQN